jgi:hypothetical protein
LNEEVLQEEESLHGETVLADTDRIVFLHRGLQLVQLTCRQRAFEALALKLIDLVIVEHTVLVHVAQFEDALEGLNALGFELLFREIVEHCSGIEHGFLREEEHLVHIH